MKNFFNRNAFALGSSVPLEDVLATSKIKNRVKSLYELYSIVT